MSKLALVALCGSKPWCSCWKLPPLHLCLGPAPAQPFFLTSLSMCSREGRDCPHRSACCWWAVLLGSACCSPLQAAVSLNLCCLCRESVWAALVFAQKQPGASHSGFTACSSLSKCSRVRAPSCVLYSGSPNLICTSVQGLSGNQCQEAAHAECPGPTWRLQPAELCLQCFG